MAIEAAGRTDVGQKRGHNEDAFAVHVEDGLVVVADGVGGGRSGEVASRLTVEAVGNFFRVTSLDPEVTWPFKLNPARSFNENRLVVGVQLANLRVREAAARDPALDGMSTTVVAISFADNEASVAHAGDSRAYRFREGSLSQITEDHTLLADYQKLKPLSPEEVEVFPYKNVIVRALGMRDEVDVAVAQHETKPGDIYLLCSDGLSGMVSDREITDTLSTASDLDKACAELIDRANAHGGVDNITAVLVRVR
ncbi:MAG: serine/threonine-protein phosphatase [Deltaproteobacteria bacterium]|nr:serine/threonine-protein phosphatase [Deltaproteobacteria bacterium]